MDWEQINKARQRLARETGTVIKDWGGRLPIALVYPNTYHTGMSNLGLHVIYRLLNNYESVVCERVFWEKENATKRLAPISLESQRPLSDFAIIAFSVSYELDYFHVVHILKSSGIPLYAADRDERHPLVIAGGPCIIANPMPLSPFFDALCIGEGETILPPMLPVLTEGIKEKRDDLLTSLASLPGIYVPTVPQNKVVRQWARCLDDHPITSAVLTRDTELGDLYLIEVERGCPWHCRFCLASHAFHPTRFHSVESILTQTEIGLKYRKRIGLVGTNVIDHPQIEELVLKLRGMGAGLSFSSLRIKPLSAAVLEAVVKSGGQTVTLAPEAGSERLRQVIKKGITEDDIVAAMEKVAAAGVKQLKLYFMVGLPTETDEDIAEIVRLTLKCKHILDQRHHSSRITLNISPFVPKAHTPFQWLGMAPLSVVSRRISLLKSNLVPHGIKLKEESPAWSEVQAILARGDAKVAEVLADVAEVSLAGWRRAVARCHLDTDYYAHQKWDVSQTLPWEVIDSGIERRHLEIELEKALGAAHYVEAGGSLASNRL